MTPQSPRVQVWGEPVRPLDEPCVAVTLFPPDHQVAVGDRGGDGLRDCGHRELCCGVGHHASQGWWGSRRTIRPLASLSSVPSALVMLASIKTFLPSLSAMRPRTVSGSSVGGGLL